MDVTDRGLGALQRHHANRPKAAELDVSWLIAEQERQAIVPAREVGQGDSDEAPGFEHTGELSDRNVVPGCILDANHVGDERASSYGFFRANSRSERYSLRPFRPSTSVDVDSVRSARRVLSPVAASPFRADVQQRDVR